jgi:hypothetical protein
LGDYQYRFIGPVNHTFLKSYVSIFPNKVTHAITIEQSKIAWNDIEMATCSYSKTKDNVRRTLFHSAIQRGDKVTIMFILEQLPPKMMNINDDYGMEVEHVDYQDWRYELCCKAAEHGQFELLKWARNQRIRYIKGDERICEFAHNSGHMEIFQWAMDNGCKVGLSTGLLLGWMPTGVMDEM